MNKLFEEFGSSTYADWKNQVIKDLKGESFETLQWQNENGITVEPFYTSENLKQNYPPAFSHSDWEISVNCLSKNEKEVNEHLLQSLNQGAGSFFLKVKNLDLVKTLNGVNLNYIHSAFEINKSNVSHMNNLFNNELEKSKASIFVENFESHTIDEWFKIVGGFMSYKQIKPVAFDASHYHNSGALAHYEIAIIFSGLIEQLECIARNKEIFYSDVVVKTSVSSDFFTQIAKLRAIRRLWTIIKEEYMFSNEIYIIAESSLYTKTFSDNHNNLLRSIVESMAAVLGGANELIVNDYDVFNSEKDSSAHRLSINQQLILKHESYLDKMADVSCGSYYIESLTDALAEKALSQFKKFENEGGFFSCIQKNIFESEMAVQRKNYEEKLISKKETVIGVNQFNTKSKHKMDDEFEIERLKSFAKHLPVLNFDLQTNHFNHA